MSDFAAMLSRTFLEHFIAATESSTAHLRVHGEVAQGLDRLTTFANQVLLEAVPSDFESLGKIGYFPFTEASIEFSYAENLALGGAHKPAYQCLRSYLELALVGLYFLSLPASDRTGRRWLEGIERTPFISNIGKALRRNQDFASGGEHVGFFDRMTSVYRELSDRTHTKGENHGHTAVSKANFPRFIPEALESFTEHAHRASSVIALGFALLRPVVLVALPIDEKFGLNPPLSGFLQEFEVDILRSLLPAEHLAWLEARAELDEEAISVRAWVESMPDVTPEQWEEQIKRQQDWFREMALPKIPQGR